jgi:hypothetical protein
MRIAIDIVEVAYKRIKVSDLKYYSCYIEESSGLDSNLGESYMGGEIRFVYSE